MAKPTWVVEVTARASDLNPWQDPQNPSTLIDAHGFVRHTVDLKDAPDYVVPITFEAYCDDPAYPTEVTLEVEVGVSRGAVIREVRQTPRRAKTLETLGERSDWPLQGMAPHEYVGTLPKLRTPALLREALAHAAMPRSRPHIDEMGYHAAEVLKRLQKKRRAPRRSSYERDLIRHFYGQALADPGRHTKLERCEYVFEKMNETLPETWQYTDGDRATADFSRLRPHMVEADAELERVGPVSIASVTTALPRGWLDR